MKLYTINLARRLYVLEAGPGFTCYGFDVLDRKARAVAAWLEDCKAGPSFYDPALALPAVGTMQHFERCQLLLRQGAGFNLATGKRCPAELTPELLGLEGRRVKVALPDGTTKRFKVGKSTGWMPCHLELANARSHGGEAVYLPKGSRVTAIT